MTREEAINLLGWLKSKTNRDDDLEAIDMAIEALQAEPTHGRLIDADTLSKKLCETTIFIKDGEVFQRMINDAPTVSVVDITQRDLCEDINCEDCPFMKETCKLMDCVAYADRPHGVWEYTEVTTDTDTYSEWVCSECGGSGYELMDFCPWCGADMRKETE